MLRTACYAINASVVSLQVHNTWVRVEECEDIEGKDVDVAHAPQEGTLCTGPLTPCRTASAGPCSARLVQSAPRMAATPQPAGFGTLPVAEQPSPPSPSPSQSQAARHNTACQARMRLRAGAGARTPLPRSRTARQWRQLSLCWLQRSCASRLLMSGGMGVPGSHVGAGPYVSSHLRPRTWAASGAQLDQIDQSNSR
jgi:hypothetical protein